MLNGRIDGEIGVGDNVEARARFVSQRVGSGDGDPRRFHLRQATEFGDPTEREGKCGILCGEGWRGNSLEREVEEYFVGDDDEIVFGAKSGELRLFVGLCVVAGGIVGVDDDGGACARSDGAFE